MTNDVSHEFQFPRPGTKMYRIALTDGPNMSNLGHRRTQTSERGQWIMTGSR